MPLQPLLQSSLDSLIDSIINLQSSASTYAPKRYYSSLFQLLPDKREYADYYILIKEPRSLVGIQDSLKKGSYSTPYAVAYDLFLVWSNAREYNEQGSQVYNDAEKLESYMKKLWDERTPPLPPFEGLPRPGMLVPTPKAGPSHSHDSERKAKRIKIKSFAPTQPDTPTASGSMSSGRILVKPRPAPVPAAPSTPSNPPITLKLSRPAAPVFDTPTPALPLLPSLPSDTKPTLGATPAPVGDGTELPAAPVVKHETRKDRRAREKLAKMIAKSAAAVTEVVSEVVTYPGIPDTDPGWLSGELGANPIQRYIEILVKLRDHTDDEGRQLATPLIDLPNPATRPDYYAIVQNPVSINSIASKASAGHYLTPEAFDRDLYHLFAVAKQFIKPDSGKVYADLLNVQRLYQELTRQQLPFPGPPKSLALASVAAGPGNLKKDQAVQGPTEDPIDGEDDAEASTAGARAVKEKDKVFLDGINFKGEIIRVGDWVHLLNPDNAAKPIIAQVFKVYKHADSAQRAISVCWYYRPEETVHPASRQFYENEVFKTGNFVEHHVEDFIERCFVMFCTRFVRGRPKPPAWTPSMPLYVVEHRYKEDVKSFKKIKNWSSCIPEQVRAAEYDLIPYPNDRTEILRRIKSPFIRGIAGPGGIGEGVEEEDEEQSRYHSGVGGEAARIKAVRAEMASEAGEASAGNAGVGRAGPVKEQRSVEAMGGYTTAAENAVVSADPFNALPEGIRSKFRRTDGDMLWFTTPSVPRSTPTPATHSLAYLWWCSQQAGKGGEDGDVDMNVV